MEWTLFGFLKEHSQVQNKKSPFFVGSIQGFRQTTITTDFPSHTNLSFSIWKKKQNFPFSKQKKTNFFCEESIG